MTLPKISVENFGPIRKGTVELRPLTVFTGDSDTGKSWLATLIYSMYSTTSFRSSVWYIENTHGSSSMDERKNLEFPENIEKWYNDHNTHDKIFFSESDLRIIEARMEKAISNMISNTERCLGVKSYKELKRWGSKRETKLRVCSLGRNSRGSLFYELTLNDDSKNIYSSIPKKVNVEKKHIINEYFGRLLFDDTETNNERLRNFLLNIIVRHLYRKGMGAIGSVYLPAGRIGLLNSFDILVTSILEKFTEKRPEFEEVEHLFPGTLSDFISTLTHVGSDNNENKIERRSKIANRIERNLLNGEIVVKFNSCKRPFFYYKSFKNGQIIPINRASSSVTQLVPLVIFLRYTVNKRNLIVLEEPEIDLHPKKQVVLIYEIAALVLDGYKILITTNSEWFTEALSNVIAYKGKTELPYVNVSDVGVWNFENRNRNAGSVIREIKWNLDEGGYQTEFEAVSRRLYNEWIDAAGDIV